MEKLLHAEKGMPDQGSWNTKPEFFVLRNGDSYGNEQRRLASCTSKRELFLVFCPKPGCDRFLDVFHGLLFILAL
ncbi:MAG: hypothetical protein ACOYM2_05445 [Rectinemataceae bacterium]